MKHQVAKKCVRPQTKAAWRRLDCVGDAVSEQTIHIETRFRVADTPIPGPCGQRRAGLRDGREWAARGDGVWSRKTAMKKSDGAVQRSSGGNAASRRRWRSDFGLRPLCVLVACAFSQLVISGCSKGEARGRRVDATSGCLHEEEILGEVRVIDSMEGGGRNCIARRRDSALFVWRGPRYELPVEHWRPCTGPETALAEQATLCAPGSF